MPFDTQYHRTETIISKLLAGRVERGFSVLSRSWYGVAAIKSTKDCIDEITLGIYHFDGGTLGEFSFNWEEISGAAVCRLNAYDDSWPIFPLFQDLFSEIAELKIQSSWLRPTLATSLGKVGPSEVSVDQMVEFLLRLGMKNRTKVRQNEV